jgi:3-methyladenine DNA glycosylase AlkD
VARATPSHPLPDAAALVERLRALGSPGNAAGMARFGIRPAKALGVPIPALRAIARETGRDHALALALWETGIHEARILATMVDEPARVTPAQMTRWAEAFDSWDVCDQACGNLFRRTPHAWDLVPAWAAREEELVRRAGFSLLAALAVHDRKAPDARFVGAFPLIGRAATDPRNFVKKAVNWSLRQIGKRNPALRAEALVLAGRLAASQDPVARWVGKDAQRELARVAALRKD